ncbi:uncharacterized protein V1516DRAFT_714224 [Lipomyces oligophaga]|uniref:uncharacterized protein n=1 Tax=Lipomyces oligophaga TaxID=45792 RepID=UPI0034CE2D5F
MPRDSHARTALADIYNSVHSARVLMVGAGGIGCELLKNLVLTGFGEVHIVDLDTIDLSNLNRQFLFGHEHIKKSKALVARETALKFNPDARLVAHHDNIKDPKFNVKWFQSFDLVFNALDNLDARRHVNRLCLTSEVPLIESGTTGFNGQVQVIVNGKTECYDCNPKPVPKSFPVCTIRSTPTQPVHCIVWAKSYLFSQLFGISEEESQDFDNSVTSDNADEIKNLQREMLELKAVKDAFGKPEFTKLVFEKVFKVDIARLLSMTEALKSKITPVPLNFDNLSSLIDQDDDSLKALAENDQPVWSLSENLAVFKSSIDRLCGRLQTDSAESVLEFDKDDEDTLDFVASAANLRAAVFGIDQKSKFEIKQIAGNIIPAIATTNAIVAGVCVLQSFKVLGGKLDQARNVFLTKQPDKLFSTERLRGPNPDCQVCGVMRAFLTLNPDTFTLQNLLDLVLRQRLGYSEEISIVTSKLLYDIEFDDNLDKPMRELGVVDGTFITIIDEEESDDGVRINLELLVDASSLDDWNLSLNAEIPRKTLPPGGVENEMNIGTKRKADDNSEPATKKFKTGSSDLIILEDDGTIDID